MEGIGGIGTGKMTNGTGKDYATGRSLMTADVNTVVEAIYEHGPAEILVNDSHGDMQNLLHTSLDPRVTYIQGNIKPLGMVQGLDGSFDAAIFLGYHARAGTDGGFLAHTGSGSVKGLWLNGVEVGEGGLNAHYAGSHGVPVIVAAGDATFAEQFGALVSTRAVATKEGIGSQVARLVHPEVVRSRLRDATSRPSPTSTAPPRSLSASRSTFACASPRRPGRTFSRPSPGCAVWTGPRWNTMRGI